MVYSFPFLVSNEHVSFFGSKLKTISNDRYQDILIDFKLK